MLSANREAGAGEGWSGQEKGPGLDKGRLWPHNGDSPSPTSGAGLQEQLRAHLQPPADNGQPVLREGHNRHLVFGGLLLPAPL